jgi:hypothetical protein
MKRKSPVLKQISYISPDPWPGVKKRRDKIDLLEDLEKIKKQIDAMAQENQSLQNKLISPALLKQNMREEMKEFLNHCQKIKEPCSRIIPTRKPRETRKIHEFSLAAWFKKNRIKYPFPHPKKRYASWKQKQNYWKKHEKFVKYQEMWYEAVRKAGAEGIV